MSLAFYLLLSCASLLLFLVVESSARTYSSNCSSPSLCVNNGVNVSYPFRFRGDPEGCGIQDFELECENERTVLYIGTARYYVLGINYDKGTIRLIDEGIQMGNYSSLPIHNPSLLPFEFDGGYYRLYRGYLNNYYAIIANIKCTIRPMSEWEDGEQYFTLMNNITSSSEANALNASSSNYTSYVLFGIFSPFNLNISILVGCGIESVHMTVGSSPPSWWRERRRTNSSILFSHFHNELACGFELTWDLCYLCNKEGTYCSWPCINYGYSHYQRLMYFIQDDVLPRLAKFGEFLAARTFFGWLLLSIYLIYKCRRRHLSAFDSIESFLQSHNNLAPIRYSYWEIWMMTKAFKEKLGEGGCGSVYKGILRSHHPVAIKLLGKSKANGQDFISEVATIGRIHHVNVVQLIGFCARGSKRALVYDFMPNGSLEKYISSSHEGESTASSSLSLSCEQMYRISLGIANGIEYLHRGCDMQILHFDIKPHNILLDENFVPKVSDFGLAKLYPVQNSIVSLTAARGTMGYMAPELFYKNIGGISYKADVYSFGMLLMEMAGRRRNLNVHIEKLSQIYFPSWIYDQFKEGNEVNMGETNGEEAEMVKKMVIVALWCIQLKPSDRPPMNKVVEMLEGEVELLQMPPKPFLTPYEMGTEAN
ncbi:LEAF RUST 10 DISEASE-RESISTANCE LOCUS RECEPTOR-LIKE PROTEIN KINASE-like 2.5 [Impatiens glandulifera]|uniref:LEAF RUST 10 DISEASE-RESISTANCE LOCUS RECEPTOR-LIKE PROTEIN KINASE-like 2.5 n=1 Tax=Impatiens glandulifera TaxID=253017 RepID=UPI001FB0DF8F|nr:LEAF RUST 10 DISEASE-RESISTANCE LOCUS RECEPTOR-LIKE PROTEIN KINASE-like 2.5 [Impatiens glandulifera]